MNGYIPPPGPSLWLGIIEYFYGFIGSSVPSGLSFVLQFLAGWVFWWVVVVGVWFVVKKFRKVF